MAASLLLLARLAQAQAPITGGPAPQHLPATTGALLDGGASLLLAGGVVHGLRRLRRPY